jgi:hypothetical protein
LTQGLLVARREYSLFPQILSSIQDYKPCGCKHPSLLIVLASEPVIDLCVQRLNETDYKMSDLEELIGQHEYSHRLRGNPLELDFIGTTKNINFVTKQLAVDICRLEASLLVLEKIAEWKMETEKNKGDASDQFQVPREIVQGSSVVDEKITYLKDTCRHQLSDAKYQEKRISALIQVVRIPPCVILPTLIQCLMPSRSTNLWQKKMHKSTLSYPKLQRPLLKQAGKIARL